MSTQEEMAIRLAKWQHLNNAIWSKLGDDTITDFTCAWDNLTDYQRELYISGTELMIVRYRMEISPLRWFWNFYYKHWGE